MDFTRDNLPHLHEGNSLALSFCLHSQFRGVGCSWLYFVDGACMGLCFLRWDVYSRDTVGALVGAYGSLEF